MAEFSRSFSEGEIGDSPVLMVEAVGQSENMEKRAQVVLKKNQGMNARATEAFRNRLHTGGHFRFSQIQPIYTYESHSA